MRRTKMMPSGISGTLSDMPKLRPEVVLEVAEHLARFGLTACPVCGATGLKAWQLPAVLSIGDVYHEKDHPLRDPDSNIMFFVMVLCDLCGHTMFFHLEHFKHGDEPVFAPRGQ
jgi:hypothetical protein